MTASGPGGLLSLPPLRVVIRDSQLSARKTLGQNYILDLNVTRRIARAAGPLQDKVILEIGPGPGGLTRALLIEGAKHVVAIERDERFGPALMQISEHSGGRLSLIFADATKADYAALATDYGIGRIVANLPYNIATPLIVSWLTGPWPPFFDKIVVMVQKEVAERLTAETNGAQYGRLSVLAQLRARPKLLFALPASVFTPSPKVSSALVEITPQADHQADFSIDVFERITAAAFGQRRKMLRSSLNSLGVDSAKFLEAAGLDPTARAEQLAVADYVRLARLLPAFLRRIASR